MRQRRRVKLFTLTMKKTLMAVMLIIVCVFVGLLGRIYYIIENDSDRYSKKVLAQQTYVSNALLYKRGDITDRNGTVLAVSIKVYDLVISPKDILSDENNKEFTINTLCEEFGLDRTELIELIESKSESQYQIITSKKGLVTDEIENFNVIVSEAKEAAKKARYDYSIAPVVRGVWFEERYARKYPMGTSACNVIGFTDGDIGNNGIEEYYNDELTGSYGREYGYFNSELDLERTVKPAVNGNTVVSSIDANVQQIVENKIKILEEEMGAENIAVMLMNPQDGEVLAMASNTVYDLNNPRSLSSLYTEKEVKKLSAEEKVKALSAIWKNFCISNTYEPGSTFKSFTVAAALDEKTSTPESTYTCNGKMQVSSFEIGCANRRVHGVVNPEKSLMESCNCALMQIAAELGRNQFYHYMKLFGFGSRTGIDLSGEELGIIHSESSLNTVELATSSFGQTQNVTMIQMLAAFCSLINGGNYYEPHVVKEILNDQGSVIEKVKGKVVRQTVTEDTSMLIQKYLESTVADGTATGAQVAGYEIGGKTGTAEKRPIEDKNYIVSFIGCAPAIEPKVAIYVLIDQPHLDDQAHSSYATQFASYILEDVLPFLGVYSKGQETISE